VLRRLWPRIGQAVVILLAAVSSALLLDFWRFMGIDDGGWQRLARAALLGGLLAGTLLLYFALRARAFSPALAEARLQALTARIRPHFLFNSLNAVLSLIRSEPRRAETALEELAELYRALMRDHRDLLPLADEIALCRQYLNLEKLRLGERLNVEWEIADVPVDLKVPPLMLQPLLENAVYHGIEPSGEAGTVRICFTRNADELHIDVANPCSGRYAGQGGNHMALANIRAPGFELSLRGLGIFEKAGRISALWVGAEKHDGLAFLQAKVETALQRAGFEPERRRFAPHVTLARTERAAPEQLIAYVQAHNLFRAPPVPVEHFTLYSSHLGKVQALYVPEVEYELNLAA